MEPKITFLNHEFNVLIAGGGFAGQYELTFRNKISAK
jgi:hypothetical protein